MKVLALLAIGLVLAGCGGSSNGGRLSASAYRAKLTVISHEADAAQKRVERGLSAPSILRLRQVLIAFVSDSQALGNEVAALKPPKDAEAANAELARGERDTAGATKVAIARISTMKTVRQALAYLQKSIGNAKGAHELDQAITELKQLGYTKGS